MDKAQLPGLAFVRIKLTLTRKELAEKYAQGRISEDTIYAIEKRKHATNMMKANILVLALEKRRRELKLQYPITLDMLELGPTPDLEEHFYD